MLTPLYLAEISPARDRGAIVSLNQLCITGGILVSYLVGYALATATGGWRWMLALGAVPGIILSIGMLVLPESPRWLAGRGRIADADTVLQQLRGTADVSEELARCGPTSRTKAASWQCVGAAVATPAPAADHRRRAGDVPADHRHQHRHLFRANDLPGGGPVFRRDIHPGDGRRRRGQCDHDDRIDLPDRPAGAAATALLESRRHGGHAVRAGRCFLAGASGQLRLDRRHVGRRLCRLLRDRPGTGVLAADRGDFPAGIARPRR